MLMIYICSSPVRGVSPQITVPVMKPSIIHPSVKVNANRQTIYTSSMQGSDDRLGGHGGHGHMDLVPITSRVPTMHTHDVGG